jgi:hypothetical protein
MKSYLGHRLLSILKRVKWQILPVEERLFLIAFPLVILYTFVYYRFEPWDVWTIPFGGSLCLLAAWALRDWYGS